MTFYWYNSLSPDEKEAIESKILKYWMDDKELSYKDMTIRFNHVPKQVISRILNATDDTPRLRVISRGFSHKLRKKIPTPERIMQRFK